MARTPKEVTDAELAVLEVLWRRAGATVREIAAELYVDDGNSETATVQKLCERLLGKHYVQRNREVRPATYRAAIDRDELVGRHLQSVADKLCDGSYTPLLTHLVQAAGLKPAEIRRLREHVARLDHERKSDGSPRDAGRRVDGRKPRGSDR